MTNPPIKRHPSLQPFSRDHYNGLVQARHLSQACSAGPAERRKALREFLCAWTAEISEHFTDEERLLLDLIPDDENVARLRNEHAKLRQLAAEAHVRVFDNDIEAEWLQTLGQTLHDHIRWEERVLFPAIEQAASETALASLEQETSSIEASRPRACSRATTEPSTE